MRVQAGLRRRAPGAGRKSPYVLSGMLRCQPCGASFALTNKTRYQCSSHHEGGDGACSVGLSVPRDRAQRIILGFTAAELPKFLTEIEARYEAPGEIAQGVLRELFPRGIWLEPDHNGGRFLWAMAQTAWPTDGPHLHHDDGTARPDAFPAIYRGRCDEEIMVAGAGFLNYRLWLAA